MRFDLEEIHGLLLPRKDRAACVHIRKTGRLAWNPKFNNLPAWKKLKPGSVVFDVGAFVGDTAKVFLDLKCEVHAFEPRPESFICLLHNCPEAHCYNVALGDHTRYSTTTRGGNMGGASLLPGDKYSIRLDDLQVRRMDVLKIDVEGFEMKVLEGGVKTVNRLRPLIHIEINTNALERFGVTPDSVTHLLRRLGYGSQLEVHRCVEAHTTHWDLVCRHTS